MIRVLCLNPTIDRMYYIDNFHSGVQFHGNRPDVYPSGKGVNVARVLSSLGDSVVLYAFIGGGNGELVREEVTKLGLQAVFFQHKGETRSTINIIDHSRKEETEITEDGEKITASEEEEFLSRLELDINEEDIIICSGLPMNGMDDNIYQKVSLLCKKKKARCVLDANRKYLKASFPGTYTFIKPNYNELCSLFDFEGELKEETLISLSNRLISSGVEMILITLGGDGAYFISQSLIYKVSIPSVEVMSTIGCGDASVAGFCHSLLHKESVEDAIRTAMACGIANAMNKKVGTVEINDVKALIPAIKLERI